MAGVLVRGEDTDTQRGGIHVEIEAEAGVRHLPAQENQEVPATTRSLKRAME